MHVQSRGSESTQTRVAGGGPAALLGRATSGHNRCEGASGDAFLGPVHQKASRSAIVIVQSALIVVVDGLRRAPGRAGFNMIAGDDEPDVTIGPVHAFHC